MAEVVIDVEVKKLIKVQRETERKLMALTGPPMVRAMRDAALLVQRDAKLGAPVDRGKLRASITPAIESHKDEVVGVVGSNVEYAPYMELGTKPHWPPPGALAVWARRHGIPEFLVARSIARKGTKARRYLQKAVTKNKREIIQRLNAAVKRIVR